jgi:hypothetical protein
MGKFNLSEAAKEVLSGNVASKRSGQESGVGNTSLNGNVAYGTQEAGDIGSRVTKTNDAGPNATKGAPTATPPGATPPVGSEPIKRLDKQFNAQAQGRQDLIDNEESDEKSIGDEDYKSRAARNSTSLAKQTFKSNPNANFHEEAEQIDELKKSTLGSYIKKASDSNDDRSVSGYATDYADKVHWDADEKNDPSERKLHLRSKGIARAVDKLTKEEEGHEDAAQDKAMIKKMIKKEKMKEDMDALLSGENLSEEFVAKAATIFEAAVVARAEEVIAEAEAHLQEQFESAVEEIKEDLASKVDDYLNYMVEEWMKENEIAIEKGLRAEIVEDFIGGLRNLFVEHYIDIPADKVDVVEELTSKVEELEASLNEEINRSVELTKSLNEQRKIEAIYTACEGLSQTQVEKLKSLAENVEFTTEEEFVGKVDVLKESYFKSEVRTADSSALDDEVQIEEETKKPAVSADPLIEQVARTISQSKK